MEKRMVIAIALSLLILVTFQRFGPKQVVPAPVLVEVAEQDVTETQTEKHTINSSRERKEEAAAPLEEVTRIYTEKYALAFSDVGGNLTKIGLNEFKQGNKEEVIFDEETKQALFGIESELFGQLENKKFIKKQGESFLEYKYEEKGWASITKRYTFDKSFDYIGLEILIKNLGPSKNIFSYKLQGPSTLNQTNEVAGRSFVEMVALIDGELWKKKPVMPGGLFGKKLTKGIREEKTGTIAWVAIKNRYFTTILKPFNSPKSVTESQKKMSKRMMTTLNSRRYGLASGESVKEDFLLYMGPISEKRIAALGYDMERIVKKGFLAGISKSLLTVLRLFHRITGSWGISIILLTLCINIVFFPLSRKSYVSMQKMKNIQPHISKLKELHKDNPQKQQKEMMELYKKYEVSPLGGCLPMLLQMPIFFGMYQGLLRSIEIKGASFLWIKDLARPESAIKLPFGLDLPVVGSYINFLPLLTMAAMVLQQKLSQPATGAEVAPEQKQQQKMMLIVMPLVFGMILYNMPAGLGLYWLSNTTLMTIGQRMHGKHV